MQSFSDQVKLIANTRYVRYQKHLFKGTAVPYISRGLEFTISSKLDNLCSDPCKHKQVADMTVPTLKLLRNRYGNFCDEEGSANGFVPTPYSFELRDLHVACHTLLFSPS